MSLRISSCLPLFTFYYLIFGISQFSFGQSNLDQSNYDVFFYGIDIHINDTNTLISGNTTIGAHLSQKSDSLILNLGNNLKVERLDINSKVAIYTHANDQLIVFSEELETKQDLFIKIWYKGDANHPEKDGAFYNKTTRNGSFTYSLTEPFASKYWFPCKEVLSDKADSVFVFATIRKELMVGSVGLLEEVVEVDTSLHQYRWKSYYPTAYYLISVAVGNYREYSYEVSLPGLNEKMPVVNYVYDSDYFSENNIEQINATADLLKLFSEKYDIYPFHNEKYGHCIVPFSGGMEHQTMTTLGSFNFELVAHELAHQWFGNYVTCSNWNNIWVNEGFASYSEYIALEELYNKERATEWMEYAHDIIKDYLSGSVYIPDDEINASERIFDFRLSYKKGAAILHMLRYELDNDDLFFQILRKFLSKYSFGNATAENFKTVLEEASGRDFSLFFKEWYYGHGYPQIGVNWYQEADTLFVVNNQSTTAPDKTKLFHISFQYKLVTTSSDTIVNHYINHNSDTLKLFMQNDIVDIEVDPGKYILMELLYLERIEKENQE